MTTKEYLRIKLSKFNIVEEQVDLILFENGLNDSQSADIMQCKMAMYKSFSEWLPIHTQISEGGVSESWDVDGIRLYYGFLCKELNKENVLEKVEMQNEIRDKSNVW